MKVQCPNCGAIGRVPDNRIPTEGANIRCPTCAFVFFVGGPNNTNVVVEADTGTTGALPAMGRTQSLPAADPSALRAPRPVADATNSGASSDPASASSVGESATPATPSTASAAPPSRSDVTAPPTDSRNLRKLVMSGSQLIPDEVASSQPAEAPAAGESRSPLDSGSYEASVQAILASSAGAAQPESPTAPGASGLGSSGPTAAGNATAAPAPSGGAKPEPARPSTSTTTGSTSTASSNSAAGPADVKSSGAVPVAPGNTARSRAVQLFKIRAKSGVVYDFHDEPAVRKWLVTRGTFEDLEYSDDGGYLYTPVLEVDHLSDLSPGGLKTRTGSLPAITPDVVAARKLTESVEIRPQRSPTTGSVPATNSAAVAKLTANQAADDSDAPKSGRIPAWRAGLYVAMVAIAALVAVVSFAPRSTGIRIPNTPAGQQLRWMLDTIGGNSASLNTTNVTSRLADELHPHTVQFVQRLQWLDNWRDSFELTAIPVSAPHRLVAQMVTEGQDTGWVLIVTEEAPPHRIVDLQFGRGNPSPQILQR